MDVITRKKPKFLLTTFNDEERKSLSDKIRHIGGILYESSNFTPLATHIVCKMPSRSEKFICGCAAGKWVLSQSYIDESYKNNQWLDEMPFEWSPSDIQSESSHKDLFILPRKWREKLKLQKGAFSNWNVVLFFKHNKKREAFRRLIEAGKGRVVHIKAPFNGKNIEMVKYVISEDMKSKDLLPFKRANVPIIGSDAVMDYIIKGRKPVGNMVQGAIDSRSNRKVLPPKTDVGKELPSSVPNLKNNVSSNRPTSGKMKVQKTVTSFFSGMKKDVSLSAESHTSDSNSVDSAKEKYDFVEQSKPTKREVNKAPCTNKSNSKAMKHSLSQSSQHGKKVFLKELKVKVSHCNRAPVLNKVLSVEKSSKPQVETAFSPIGEISSNSRSPNIRAQTSLRKMCREVETTGMVQTTKLERKHLNQSQASRHDIVPFVDSSISNVLRQDSALINPIDLTISPSCIENTSNEDIAGSGKKGSENQSNTGQKVSRKRQREDADKAILCQSPILRPNTARSCHAVDGLPKKQKLSTGSSLQQSKHGDLSSIFEPLLIKDVHRRRIELHNVGTNTIEGFMEEGLHKEAVAAMGSCLSSTFYLSSNILATLMKMLTSSSDGCKGHLLVCICSILNRCITLHPPYTIPDVYLTAFKMAGKSTGIVESNSAFDYVTSVFGKEALLELAKFISAIVEVDFNFHRKRFEAGILHSSDRKFILKEILSCPMDRIGSGRNVKKLIKLATEMSVQSIENQLLIPLRGMVFALLNLVAQSCQMSDMQTISANYGPACTDFTRELYESMCNITNDTSRREIALTTMFYSLKPNWLAARVADLYMSTYDASCVNGTARQLLTKPLSLEKIVSCYFFLIPTDSNGNLYSSNRKSSPKPLTTIGENNTASAKLTCKPKGEKTLIKRNLKGETKLHVACIRNRPAEVKTLLMCGMDPNLKDNAGWTALHEASNHGNEECVAELLVSKDLDMFATGINGYTALHDAVENNHFEVVKLLVKSAGMALLNMKTTFGATAVDLARTTPMKDLLSILQSDVNSDSTVRSTYPESVVVQSRDITMFLRLLAILLRSFIPESNEQLDLPAKVELLKDHVKKLKEKQSRKSISLFNMIKNMFSYAF